MTKYKLSEFNFSDLVQEALEGQTPSNIAVPNVELQNKNGWLEVIQRGYNWKQRILLEKLMEREVKKGDRDKQVV